MLIGHEKNFERLKALAGSGRLHHAQLFIGPEHVGKTKTALLLSVFLQGAEENPVLKKQILEGLSADKVLFLDGGDESGSLSIETVRGIVERSSQSHSLPYLIFVIENIGRMKVEAVNSLLKTLEEPHEGTVFFLTANNEEEILPTLRSRCFCTYFQTVSEAPMRAMCGDNVYAEQLLFFAMGRPGKLRRLLDDMEYFQAHQTALQDVLGFMENPRTPGVFALTRKYEASALLSEMLDIFLQRARTLALSQAQAGSIPPVLAHLDFVRAVESIEACKQDLRQNVNRKLSLENLLLPFVP